MLSTHIPSTLPTIKSASAVINCEALAIHRPNLELVKKLNDLFSDAMGFVDRSIMTLQPMISFGNDIKIKELTKHDFAYVMDTRVMSPVGLSVTWLEYMQVLKEAQKITSGLFDDVIQPFSSYLSTLVNSPDKLGDRSFKSRVKMNDLSDTKKKLEACFKGGSVSERKLNACIKRNTDWTTVTDTLKDIVDTQESVKPSLLKQQIDIIDRTVELLFEKINDPNKEYRLNTSAIAEMSQICYSVADQVSFYALISAHVIALSESISQAKKTIAKMSVEQ